MLLISVFYSIVGSVYVSILRKHTVVGWIAELQKKTAIEAGLWIAREACEAWFTLEAPRSRDRFYLAPMLINIYTRREAQRTTPRGHEAIVSVTMFCLQATGDPRQLYRKSDKDKQENLANFQN